MFPLRVRQIGGYTFGAETFYSAHHLGTDYKANFVELYAPFNGESSTATGVQGGKTITFRPDGQDVVMRFMHLSEMHSGHFNEGDQIGVTGNTGSATTGAHLHIDISKGSVNINDFSNFIDPESYDWGQGGSMNEEQKRELVKVVRTYIDGQATDQTISADMNNIKGRVNPWQVSGWFSDRAKELDQKRAKEINDAIATTRSADQKIMDEKLKGLIKPSDCPVCPITVDPYKDWTWVEFMGKALSMFFGKK